MYILIITALIVFSPMTRLIVPNILLTYKALYCSHVNELPHGKTTYCIICENKDADQLRGYREADYAFVFATWIVQSFFFINPKFQASSLFLCLYRQVCVRPGRNPNC